MSHKNQVKDRRLTRIVIYLSEDSDRELIDHFAKFAEKRKVSYEGKRLWLKALVVESRK